MGTKLAPGKQPTPHHHAHQNNLPGYSLLPRETTPATIHSFLEETTTIHSPDQEGSQQHTHTNLKPAHQANRSTWCVSTHRSLLPTNNPWLLTFQEPGENCREIADRKKKKCNTISCRAGRGFSPHQTKGPQKEVPRHTTHAKRVVNDRDSRLVLQHVLVAKTGALYLPYAFLHLCQSRKDNLPANQLVDVLRQSRELFYWTRNNQHTFTRTGV